MNNRLTVNPGNQVSFWNKKNIGKRTIAVAVLLTGAVSVAQSAETVNEALEPCINGEVSASGNYASDAEEAFARSLVAQENAAQLALEPCINGEVSASGAFPTQALEDHAYAKTASEPSIQGEFSPTEGLPNPTLGQGTFAHSR